MIKKPATRIVSVIAILIGLATSTLLNNGDTSPSMAIEPLPVHAPKFRVQWRQGELTMSGHTTSLRHEQDLLQVATSKYPEHTVTANFQPLGIVPDYWAGATVQMVYLLTGTLYSQATLSTSELNIRSVINDEPGWLIELDAMQKMVPDRMAVVADTILIDRKVNVSDMCERAFSFFQTGLINFEESSARFRSSAYPSLDRVIALANACSDSRISITGHTDASGSEAWNKILSLNRANAVGDYIVKGGVHHTRLQISGVGSSVPIADESTRYGRSLNRRIEIDMASEK